MEFKYVYLIIILTFSTSSTGQNYFSKILPTTDNPLTKRLEKNSDKYIISSDFFNEDGVRGGFIEYDEYAEEVTKYKYDNMDMCSNPTVHADGYLYSLGENPFRENDSTFFISKIDAVTYNQIWYKEFNVASPRHNPRAILNVGDKLYVFNVNLESNNGNYPQEISLHIFDMDGNRLVVKRYNTSKNISYLRRPTVSSDNSIIMSCKVGEENAGPDGPYSQLMKIDLDGGIIWSYEGTEDLPGGALIWDTELSNGSIVQNYHLDRLHDLEFIANNYSRYANRLLWFNRDGKIIDEKLIVTDNTERISYSGLKRGKEDYFYVYGYMDAVEDLPGLSYYAHLTKFSNEGDTIWTHNYQHPKHKVNGARHSIDDIIEEENGDITVLAYIKPIGVKADIWLFRLNSDGCYINEDCEDMSDLTSDKDILESKVVLYPNPTSGLVNLKYNIPIKEILVTDSNGKKVFAKSNFTTNTDIDLSNQDKGVYIFHIIDLNGNTEVKRIIKL